MKSKIPCPPGLVPVANVDHATGVCAGYVVRTREYPPSSRRRARFGSSPRSSIGSTIFGSRPSSPITITFFTGVVVRCRLETHEPIGPQSLFRIGARKLAPDSRVATAHNSHEPSPEHENKPHYRRDGGGKGQNGIWSDIHHEFSCVVLIRQSVRCTFTLGEDLIGAPSSFRSQTYSSLHSNS